MRRAFTVARRVLLTTLSEPKTLLPMLILPLVFTLLFSFVIFRGQTDGNKGPAKPQISFLSLEATSLTAALRTELGGSPALAVTDQSEDRLRESVRTASAVAGVIVPVGFTDTLLAGKQPDLVIVRQEQSNAYLGVKSEVVRCVERLASAIVAADLASPDRTAPAWSQTFDRTLARWHAANPDIVVTAIAEPAQGRSVPTGNVISIGFCIMFVMLSVMLSSGTILEERTAGTWQRLLAAPIRRAEIIGGYLLGFFVTGWVQFGILILTTRFAFGISWGDPLGVIVLSSVFIIAATAIGLAVAGLSKTDQQQSAFANIGVVVTSMLAGVYWPYEMMPRFMQQIGKFMPQYWAMRGYTDLLVRGRDFTALGLPLGILIGISVILLAFGISRIKFE